MRILRAVFRHGSGRIGGGIVCVYLLLAILGLLGLTPHNPITQYRIDRLHAPSAGYWMGTDLFGRDVASRLMAGIGQSFTVAFFSVTFATLAATVLGLAAAWLVPRRACVVMRVRVVLLA
ncbi:ABC transporter permease, partial [Mesorhizobium sp. M2D.F.Ca.ET.145.01.1.1]